MQQGLRPSGAFQAQHALRGVLPEGVQTAQQALPCSCELAWHVARRGGEGLKTGDGVTNAPHEEGHPVVTRAPASLGKQRMSRGAYVELGDEVDRDLEAPWKPLPCEVLVAQVFVDMPHPAPFTLPNRGEESRAAVAQTEGW